MGRDAVRDLRDWQRREATAQETALRKVAKAQQRLRQLDDHSVAARDSLATALEELAATGVTREQAAVFLGVAPASLPGRSARTKSFPSTGQASGDGGG
jgi:hypothetical protein